MADQGFQVEQRGFCYCLNDSVHVVAGLVELALRNPQLVVYF